MAGVQGKRDREEEGVGSGEGVGSTKRLHLNGLTPEALELLHLLEDSDSGELSHEGGECGATEEVVCGVMRSLEEEICSTVRSAGVAAEEGVVHPLPCADELMVDGSNRRVDHMSYLLEASDDELGIPPSGSAVGSPVPVPVPREVAYCGGDCIGFSESPCLGNVWSDAFWVFEDEGELTAAGYGDWLEEPGLYVYDENQFGSCNSLLFELSDLESLRPLRQEAATCAM